MSEELRLIIEELSKEEVVAVMSPSALVKTRSNPCQGSRRWELKALLEEDGV